MNKIMNFLTANFGTRDISQYPELWDKKQSKVYVYDLAACVYVQPADREFRSLNLDSI